MKKVLILNILLLLFTKTTVFAQSVENIQSEEEMIVAGINSNIAIDPWYSKTATNSESENVKGRVRIDGFLNISECIQLKTRIATGEKYNTEWFNTGLGTEEGKFKIFLRQLYVSIDCLEQHNIKFEVGTIPVSNYGTVGLSNNGSVDGINVYFTDKKHNRNYIVTVGNIKLNPNIFEHQINQINYESIQVQQILDSTDKNRQASIAVSNYENTIYGRIALQWTLSQYSAWLKKLQLQTTLEAITENDHIMGGLGGIQFLIASIQMRVIYSHLTPNPTSAERLSFSIKQFYGFGNNIYFEFSKKLNSVFTSSLYVRFGDAGTMIFGGVNWNFSKSYYKKQ